MSVESIKGQAIEKLLNRSGNGRSQLESFGFFLDKYVIQGADITLDARNPRKFTLSEAIISIDDGLYRVSSETMTVRGVGATFFVDMTVRNGFIVNSQHPNDSFIPLWQINMDSTGNIISTVDVRGTMGYVRFRKEIQGIITDQFIVDEAHIANQAVTTNKIAPNSITLGKMQANSVGTSQILSHSITANKLVDNSITDVQLANAAVTRDKIGFNAQDVPYSGLVAKTNIKDAVDDLKSNLKTLSTTGDFTGTWFGDTYGNLKSQITNGLVLYQTVIDLLNSGTGLNVRVYDGKFFDTIEAIGKTIDGGSFLDNATNEIDAGNVSL